MPSHKTERIASDIARNISDILMNEANDELLKKVTITGCDVSSDLSFCKVYFTALSDMSIPDLEKEMNEASSFIRGKVSERVDIRHTPELRFIFDKSIAYGERIENIIKTLENQE